MPSVRFPQPYRGQPRPKYPRPQKRLRDLKLENRLRISVIGLGILILILILEILLYLYRTLHEGIILFFMFAVTLFSVLIIIAVAEGLKSVDRFRKGYDIDTSDEEEQTPENPFDES